MKKSVLNHFSFLNIHGLKPKTVQSKILYVNDLLKEQDQLFIGLTETWLNNHLDAELSINGYRIHNSN